ncbi:kinesin motor family protein [Striga asiatica]|uniref:Kinesin-like protein n=1 Tax=Striga asiatica TaxID=4170 RepID=A0A5A7RCW8_STRAF|nr:kinesin motor family protein [Striga asiatica]
MGPIGAEELMNSEKLQGIMGEGEEKILVLVRLRPLSEKEIAKNEASDWECINSTTILYRNNLQERSGLPTAYTFDKVFRGDCKTREVYDEGIKDIALSVLGGINSTVFAYGQTSSGKTYTMNGITEYAVADFYDYMQRHEETAFALKFSAMEIYNEVVRDLLSTDSTPLRLLDDPERGTIIEKLTEETLRDWNHLRELLSICKAQRQVGETSLNETSSRSHQILRLVSSLLTLIPTIESSAREFIGKGNSTTLAASVNFVDLAGSERASQAFSVGQRLKEGSHINRSLLTLGTVIRKLSKGRQGHVNYRDSKLTRILQPALGGNARTAIICTLSPARSHLEQSRNTLQFASCAKEVVTNAKVNVVMSDKALVKHLQKEVARLESELRTPGSMCDHGPLLRKKDMQIEKVLEKENKELKSQREVAHSRIDDLLRAIESGKTSEKLDESRSVNGGFRGNGKSGILHSENSEDAYSSEAISDPSQEVEGPFADDSDEICKEVVCIQNCVSDNKRTFESLRESVSESETNMPISSEFSDGYVMASPGQVSATDNIRSYSLRPQHDAFSPCASSTSGTHSGSLKLTRSRSSSDFEMGGQRKSMPSTILEEDFTGRSEGIFKRKQWKLPPVMYGANSGKLFVSDSESSDFTSFVDEIKNEISSSGDEDIPTLGSFVAGLREMAKLQYENQNGQQVQETERTKENNARDVAFDPMNSPLKFEKLQKLIIELWQACNVSLVHRTYFILIIKDDPADSFYMEVERRRLSFLKETFSRVNCTVQAGRTFTLASRNSKRALRRERETLSKLIYKRYREEDERHRLYNEWGISLNSKKRRLQLVNLLWTDTENMDHIRKSADIVAKLIGFLEHGRAVDEMLGLSFMPPRGMIRKSFGWKYSMASIF